jgi:hypothetical protein
MSYPNVTKLTELIKQLDIHQCLELKCDGHCSKKCGAGGGHNIKLLDFYKKKLIDILHNIYCSKKNAYEIALHSAEERDDVDDFKLEFDNAELEFRKILGLYMSDMINCQ